MSLIEDRGRPRLIWKNLADFGAVTAQHADAGTPATNLQNDLLSRPWRTPIGVTTSHIDVDLGAPQEIDYVGLIGVNFSEQADIRVYLSVLSPAGQDVFDCPDPVPFDPEWPDVHCVFREDQYLVFDDVDTQLEVDSTPTVLLARSGVLGRFSARFVRIAIADAGSSTLSVGRVVVGRSWRFARSHAWPTSFSAGVVADQSRSLGGHLWQRYRHARRAWSLQFQAIDTPEFHKEFWGISRGAAAISRVVLITDDMSDSIARDSIYGSLQLPLRAEQYFKDVWRLPITVEGEI